MCLTQKTFNGLYTCIDHRQHCGKLFGVLSQWARMGGTAIVILAATQAFANSDSREKTGQPLIASVNAKKGLTSQDLLTQGIKHLEKEEYSRALHALTEAMRADPHSFVLLVHRSRAYVGLKRYQEALTDASAAIGLQPDDHHGYGARALVYWRLNKFDESIADFSSAIELAPSPALLYSMRASVYLDSGKADKALGDFSKAIELGREKAGVFRNRGIAFSRLGRYDEAVQDFTEALTRSPDHVVTLMYRGSAYRCLGKYNLAKPDLDRALQVQPNDLESRLQRSFVAIDTGDFRSALDNLMFAKNKKMKDPYLFLSLSYVAYRLKEMSLAVQTNDQALLLATPKTKPAALLQRAILLLVQGKSGEARKLFEEGRVLAQQADDLDSLDDALDELKRLKLESSITQGVLNTIYDELEKARQSIPPPLNRPHAGCQARS